MCRDGGGEFAAEAETDPSFMSENILSLVIKEMVADGCLTNAEALHITFPFFYRSSQEFEAPLESNDFELLVSKVIQLDNPLWEQHVGKTIGDGAKECPERVNKYAVAMCEFCRSWSETAVRKAV